MSKPRRPRRKRYDWEKPLPAPAKAWVEQHAHAVVCQAYTSWRTRREWDTRAKEPRMTVTTIREDLDQRGGCDDYAYLSAKQKSTVIRSALKKLEKRGHVEASLGIGARNREATVWNPVSWSDCAALAPPHRCDE